MRISSHQALLHFSSSGRSRSTASCSRWRQIASVGGSGEPKRLVMPANAISGSTTWETSKVERHASANAAADRSAFSEAGEKSIAQTIRRKTFWPAAAEDSHVCGTVMTGEGAWHSPPP